MNTTADPPADLSTGSRPDPDHSRVDVLVVGAGPVGLATAITLAFWGVDVAIVEADDAPITQSRAVWVHPRTAELLHGLGVTQQMRDEAVLLERIDVHRGDADNGSIHYDGRGRTRFPEGMIIEQSRTQRLLLRRAAEQGVVPVWGHRVVSVRQDGRGVDVELLHTAPTSVVPSGQAADPPATRTIRARYVVGADGATSTVRAQAGLELVGDTYETSFFTGDLLLRTRLHRTRAHLSVTPGRTYALLPLPGEDRWRVVATVTPEVEQRLGRESGPTGGPAIGPSQVREIMADLRVPHEILGQDWATLYRSHHRVVDTFRVGRILLAGDAAHIHSPAGGLGMNTGIGDAADLGWRLAIVARREREGERSGVEQPATRVARERLLDDYSEERRSVALDVLRTSDRAFTIQAGSGRLTGLLRTALVPAVPAVINLTDRGRRLAFDVLSGVGITYRDLASSTGPGTSADQGRRRGRRHRLQVGDRLPFAETADGQTSHDPLRPDRFVLLGVGTSPAALHPLAAALDRAGIPTTHTSMPAEVGPALGLDAPAAALVRPDGHVWWLGTPARAADLSARLSAVGADPGTRLPEPSPSEPRPDRAATPSPPTSSRSTRSATSSSSPLRGSR